MVTIMNPYDSYIAELFSFEDELFQNTELDFEEYARELEKGNVV